jgi:hypothetical protein
MSILVLISSRLKISYLRLRSSRMYLIYSVAISIALLTSPPTASASSLGVNSNKLPNNYMHNVVLKPISVLGCSP